MTTRRTLSSPAKTDKSRLRPAFLCAFALLLLLAGQATAQELYLLGGVTRNLNNGGGTAQWSIHYQHPWTERFDLSLSYLNEGHQSRHYRDALAAQVWWHRHFADGGYALALGIGPFLYFDTKLAPGSDRYRDAHGMGAISSATATWRRLSPVLFQVRLDYLMVRNSFDSLCVTAGMGYLLGPSTPTDAPKKGDLPPAGPNAVTLYLGRSVLNSARAENETAGALEYRRTLGQHLDWTVTLLHEGDQAPLHRTGITTQVWIGERFLDERLDLGFGAGPYVAQDKGVSPRDRNTTILAVNLGATAGWRLDDRLGIRLLWGRIVTDSNRDTDLFLGGMTYRF